MPRGAGPTIGLRMPQLDGIALEAETLHESDVHFRVARALIDAGVASARRWGGNLKVFIDDAMTRWVEKHGGSVADRRFDLAVELRMASGVRSERSDEARDRNKNDLLLTLAPEFAGTIHIGPMIKWLEPFDARLPATMLYAIGSNYVVDLYDYVRAADYYEMRIDGMDEEDLKDLELPDLTIPEACGRLQLSSRAIAQRRRRWPSEVCTAVDAALELNRLSASYRRIRPRFSKELRDFYYAQPLPAMIVTFAQNDHVQAAFDDEAQYMGAEGDEAPNALWLIKALRTTDVRAAFDGLAKAIEIVAATVRLFDTFPETHRDVIPPEHRSGQPARNRTLAEVFAPQYGAIDDGDLDLYGDDDDDDEEAA